ncbi:MAG: MerR family transcriptional regulator [Myxococcaceae bacterium]|nr:MerR family transcriptional regulator [Myxococcaceae bacterium]
MSAAPKPSTHTEYRIDDLARAARTTVRNVRSYQEKGLLPPPRRDGRAAVYDEAHLARLRLIGTLLERGYSLQNIAELIGAWENGQNLRDLLGLEAALTDPFSDESPTFVSLQELNALFGTGNASTLNAAVQAGLLEPFEGRFRTPSLRLLKVGAELHRAGVPLPMILQELKALRKDLDRMTARFVGLVADHVFAPHLGAVTQGSEAKKLTDLVHRLRPLAEVVVTSELQRSMEKQVQAQVGEQLGKLFEKTRPKR